MKHGYTKQRHKICFSLGAILSLAVTNARAEQPRVYALTNPRIVAAPGRVIEKGTLILRDGLIEAVSAKLSIPPEAVEIDASGICH